MKYKAEFNYIVFEGKTNKLMRFSIPVQMFRVDGGAKRFIELKTTDDISISSEFEQARSLKNLTLYLPPAKDGSDMEIALELTNIATLKKSFNMSLNVEKYSCGKLLLGLSLSCQNAVLTEPPYVVMKQLLKVNAKFTVAELTHGKMQRGKMIYEEV